MRVPPTARLLALLSCALGACTAPDGADAPVGHAGAGGTVVSTGRRVRPVGQVLRFSGRPVDLVLSREHDLAYVKETHALLVVDLDGMEVVQQLPLGEDQGASMHGIALSAEGRSLWVTDAGHGLREARVDDAGRLTWGRTVDLSGGDGTGEPYPCGLALTADGTRAAVCLSRRNALALVDLASERVTARVPVGVAPFDVVLAPDERTAYVSNFGGRHPAAGEHTAESSGTQVLVDERGIAASGTLTRVDIEAGRATGSVEAGLHPTDLERSADGALLYVAAANSDAAVVVDAATLTVRETIDLRLDPGLPFGCISNALALSPDGRRLFVANAGNDAVAVVDLGRGGASARVAGFVPTDWFPGAVACRGDDLVVACVRGDGSRADGQEAGRRHVRDLRGSVARVPLAGADLARWTAQAREDARVPAMLRAAERARTGVAPRPVPARDGEPSVFRHVVYVIKENRTYDQVLGDLPQGNGDPTLTLYGREVTPNHHALAEEFVLLDNYYCNGVVSADGHQWATQGIVVDYQEKQFGGWTRSYDFGTDALTYAASDFLWDAALLAGLSFRNYGELDFPTLDPSLATWYDVHRAWRAGGADFRYTPSVPLASLARYTSTRYPGWHMKIPDQLRVDRFLEEFREAERTGEWPELVLVYLPQDHTSGTRADAPTPRAHVADNDLALGRLVEAISHSRFWSETCIFVNEDDPQDGFDHVDGHRSLCLVVSPYTRRGAVVRRFYDQTSVLRTIGRILGLAPLNQVEAAAATMEACFQDRLDATPYRARPANVPLDEPNPRPGTAALDAQAAQLARTSAEADLSRPDRVDDDAWNRVLWHAAKGAAAYPSELAGAHGRGLAALRLELAAELEAEDEDGD